MTRQSAQVKQRGPEAAPHQLVGARRPARARAPLHRLHDALGNHGVLRCCGDKVLRAKLLVGAAGDVYEQEANRVAAQVMRQTVGPVPQVRAAESAASGLPEAPSVVEQVLRSPGRPLNHQTRQVMESRLGRDFSEVRVHTGPTAATSARAVGARAYTVGRDVVLGEGGADRRLLAHELVHVGQQGGRGRGYVQREATEDPRVRRLNFGVQETLDEDPLSYKPLLQALLTARRIGGIPQLIADLRARHHKEHGNYFVAFLTRLRNRGSEGIYRVSINLMKEAGVAVPEVAEDYPLRYEIANYIGGKIEETKKILIGEPRDSIWWILKGALIETFYTFEEGFVDVLRVGKGSEEAARAYAFEKDATNRWCGVVKGLGEDFLRLTALAGPLTKAGAQTAEKTLASRLASKADDAVSKFAREAEGAAAKATRQAEKQAAKGAADAAQGARKQARAALSGEAGPVGKGAVGPSKMRRPRGFEPTSKGTKRRVKAGTMEGLEPTARKPAPRPRKRSVTRQEQLEGIRRKSPAEQARQEFKRARNEYAEQLGVGKGGDVHHAIELDVLDRYPGAFSAEELNSIGNMRGIPAELLGRKELHSKALRSHWNRHYRLIDAEIKRLGLRPGTAAYDELVRRYATDAAKEVDHVLGQFFSESRREVFRGRGVPVIGR